MSIRDSCMSLFLVRHGETHWNREGRIQGVLDSPLTEQGKGQARVNGELLHSLGVTDLIASPLGRAAHTARIMAEVMNARHEFDDRLQERNCGAWGGMTWQQAQQSYPDNWNARFLDPYGFSPPGGESLVELEPRIRALLEEIETRLHESSAGERRLGVVTHGITMRVLLRCLLKLDRGFVRRVRCPNSVAYEVVFKGKEPMCRHYLNGAGPIDGLFLDEPDLLSRN